VSPFYFWLLKVSYCFDGFLIAWFFSFQKVPYIFIYIFYFLDFFLLVLFGIFLCNIQVLILKVCSTLRLVLLVESFNWMLLSLYFIVSSFFLLFVYYCALLYMTFVSNFNFYGFDILFENVFFFFNLPFAFSFYLKVVVISFISNLVFVIRILMMLKLVLTVISVCEIFFKINLTREFQKKGYFSFLVFSFWGLFVLFC